MKNMIIWGPKDLGRLLNYYIKSDDPRKVVAFTVDKAYMDRDSFCGLPVIPFEDLKDNYCPDEYEILIAVGNSKMNNVRKNIFCRCKDAGYQIASYIHSSCSVHSTDIGEGNIMLENCLIYPYSKIGSGNLLWDHVLISHDCVVGDFNTFSSYADLCGYVKIGNNGYFGKHCILNDYLEIADYSLIGAGSYVKAKTKEYDVVVPPRSIVLENKKSLDLM